MIRRFEPRDINAIQAMNQDEGWDNLVVRHEQTFNSWLGSQIAYVYEENGEIMGCVRGLTDGQVTLYICELIVRQDARGNGIGNQLLQYTHNLYPTTRMELLASSSSRSYYEASFRPFYGYRRTYGESL